MVLSKQDITYRCKHEQLIVPYKMDLIQTCSYDLTFSGEYYFYDINDNVSYAKVKNLKKGEKLAIPADAICYVLTNETINMPNNLTATISLSFGLIKKGVMLSNQPPFDPGYSGKVVALLHNLSDEDVIIEKNKHILNMVFSELKTPLPKEELYDGQYQHLTSLDQYCTQVKKGAVFVLAQELEKQKKETANFLPQYISFITIIITCLTVLITVLGFDNMLGESSEEKNVLDSKQENNILYEIESGKTKKVILNHKEEYYIVDFENESITKVSGD